MGSKRWPASLAAMGLGLGALALVPLTAGASSAAPRVFRAAHLHARFDAGIQRSVTPAQLGRLNAASVALKTFTASVTDPVNSKTYKYSMVGTNPQVKGTTSSTTITTYLVPVLIKFPGGLSWSPSVKDSCDSGATPLARTQQSPVFVSRAWTFGGTAVGSGQYTDAFQRASFWKSTQPSGTNPTFAVNMTLKTLAKITINVPSADAAVASGGSCGNGDLGAVNIAWLQNYLEKTAIPALASTGVKPNTFPIFLLHNVVGYVNTTANCCVLGYHNAFSTSSGTQTYGVADYENSGFFSGISDVEPLSHEAAEWMDDPSGANPTAPWGNVGQVSGCQSNLEVGDPLSGTTINVSSGGFTYHVQELAFFSWFYHQSPSLGVKGWYSNNGTFKSYAAHCP
jgi:hypothetical protein